MSIQAAPGVFDIIPEDKNHPWRDSSRWDYIERVMKKVARDFNYKEIRTPIFERKELFHRSVGEETDIVSKEMYTFIDKGERSLTLRPEGTAPVVRAGIENRLFDEKGLKLFYTGPLFRYERMQAGRYRQFHQFGVEAFGDPSPEQDAEIIDIAYQIYARLGIKGLKVRINSLGDKPSRDAFREALIVFLQQRQDHLSEDSKTRLLKNPLRVLDSKDPKDQEVITHAPSILDFLNPECLAHFERLKELLASYEIPFEVDNRLVRGLDYYQKTVFEILSSDLGSQNALCGGGRFDGLVKLLGGPDTPSTGFALGMERLLQVMLKQELSFGSSTGPLLYIIPIGQNAKNYALKLSHELRSSGISVEIDFINKKVGKAISKAVDQKSRYALVLGDNELEQKTIELKELSTEQKIPLNLDALKLFLTDK